MSDNPRKRKKVYKIPSVRLKMKRLRAMRTKSEAGVEPQEIRDTYEDSSSTDVEATERFHCLRSTPSSSAIMENLATPAQESKSCSRSTPSTSAIMENLATPAQESKSCSSEEDYSGEIEVERVKQHIESVDNKEISGRRLVDIQDFFKEMQKANDHYPFTCNLSHMDMCSETHDGLICTIKLKCSMCQIEKLVRTETPTEKLNVNSALVLATISTGLGLAQTTQMLSGLDMPQLSRRQFNKHFELVSETIFATSWEAMEEAGIEEGRIARQTGHVDKNANPVITVIADGAWSKRSYKTKYDASSGVACIVGAQTGKILFVAVRNKYCPICARAKAKNVPVGEHKCYKNWSGTSTAMESDIILEGFKRSMEMHGLKYTRLVGDGDSSVYKKLCTEKPYGNEILIEKVECKNHLLRNFCTKLRELTTKNVSSRMVSVSPRLRNLLKANIERLRKGINVAVTYRRKEEKTVSEQIDSLKKDIINCPKHVFGEHSECDTYFCTGPKENEVNEVPNLVECGLFDDVIACCNRLTYNAQSLLLNMNNNAAETYNAVVAKFAGGKRINFALKNSYEVRCHAACVSYNRREEYHRVIHKKMVQRSPGIHTVSYMAKLRKRRLYLKSRRQLFSGRPRKTTTKGEADADYGLVEDEDVIPTTELEKKKASVMEYLSKTREELTSLERESIGQSSNPLWKKERSLRLTASNFGIVCKRRQKTDGKKVARRLVFSTFSGSMATNWGQDHEDIAKKQFSVEVGLQVEECGLFMHPDTPYLGASPDGLVGNDAIIEVKCPYKLAKLKVTPREAAERKLVPYLHMDGEHIALKRTHNYFFQIQGQLAISGRKVCYFIVWTPIGMTWEKIEKDDDFWRQKMKPKLEDFYKDYMLPLLALKEQ